MRNLIKKILKESDIDYWKDYAERKKKDDKRKEKEENGILGKLLSDTRMGPNNFVYTKWFPTRFSVDSLGSEVFQFLYKEFERYCKKNFGLSDREDILELWGDYTNSVIDMIGQPITEVYNIFEDDEEEFDPFGHITDQNEEETELEDLGFNLDKDCVLGFSKNNAKLEWPYFSLPAGYTCPFATVCKNFPAKWEGPIKGGKFKKPASWEKNVKPGPQAEIMCYAARAQGQYPGANIQAFKNLDLLKRMKTKEKMANLIIKSMEYHGLANTDILRIHEAGDFFSQDYLDAWIEVAKRMPQTLFYAYTVSLPYYMARKNSLPKNFKVIASMDKHNEKFIMDNGLRYSRVVGSEEEARELGLPIDVDDSIAWGSDDNFALVIHGSQPKGSEAAETLKQNRKSGLYDKIKQAKKSNQQNKDTLRDRLRKKLRSESFISENIDWIMDTEPSDFGYGVYDSLKDAAISQLGDYNNISLGDNVVFEGDNFTVYAVEIASGREIVTLKNQRTNKNFQIVIYDPLPPEWGKELPPIREDLEYWGVRGDKMGPLKEDDFSWDEGDSLDNVTFKTKERPDLTYRIKDDNNLTVRIHKEDGEFVNAIVRDYVDKKFESGEWYPIHINESINESDDEVTTLKGHRDYDNWVFIHRNLNRPPYYSIKAGKSGGPVIGYDTDIHLKDVIFKVQRGGQSRVRKEMRKNVHAGVVGKIKDSGGNYDTTGWTLVTYNPYQHDSFVEYETGEPIYNAKEVVMKNEKEVWVKK
ncbi:hypothetical protein N9966_00960 [bacterium]|nr:hypothetical protein [bacterium]